MNYITYPASYTFSISNNISISVKRSSFTFDFLKFACHANLGAKRNFAESSSYILIHIFIKFSNTPANNNDIQIFKS